MSQWTLAGVIREVMMMEVNMVAAVGGIVLALVIFLGLFYLSRWSVRRERRRITKLLRDLNRK